MTDETTNTARALAGSTVEATPAMVSPDIKEVVFIDRSLPDVATLVSDVRSGVQAGNDIFNQGQSQILCQLNSKSVVRKMS